MDNIQLKHKVQPYRQFSQWGGRIEELQHIAMELICMLHPGITVNQAGDYLTNLLMDFDKANRPTM